MITASKVNFEPQIDKLRSQISELVEQYANLAYAPKPFYQGKYRWLYQVKSLAQNNFS